MKRIVCTTGISIQTNAQRFLGNKARKLSTYTLLQQFVAALKSQAASQQEFLAKLSAETNSLSRLGISQGDEVILLHTQTNSGKEAAEALEKVLRQELRVHVETKQVWGLQVSDAQRFRREGIRHLFEILKEKCVAWREKDPDNRKVLLDATGGFKAVVPYLTLFGLMWRIEVVYIFENSNTLIRLPPLPLHFNYELLAQGRTALQRLLNAKILPAEEFFREIPGLMYEDRAWFEPLIERDEKDYVTLSGLGEMFVQEWVIDTKHIHLSPMAKEVYDKSRGDVRERLRNFLKLLQDPLWRNAHLHSFSGTDLQVYKLPHQPERVAGFVQGDKVFVCLIYLRHDEYERDLPGRRVAEFREQVKEFVPLEVLEEAGRPAGEEPDEFGQLREQNERLTNRVAELSAEIERLQAQLEELENECLRAEEQFSLRERQMQMQLDERTDQIRALEMSLSELTTQKQLAEQQLAFLENQLSSLRDQLRWAHRPWWRKLFRLPPRA